MTSSLALASLLGCSASLPRPPSGPIPRDAWEEVPYPPPPARVEIIPPRKGPRDVWVDGQWDWDGKAWKWIEGVWMEPEPGTYFTRWTTERRSDGRLFFAGAAWRDGAGRPLTVGPGGVVCPPPAPSAVGAGPVTGR